jgi:hypothetical protein
MYVSDLEVDGGDGRGDDYALDADADAALRDVDVQWELGDKMKDGWSKVTDKVTRT